MKTIFRSLTLLLTAGFMLSACSSRSGLSDFKSDACSLFPNASLISGKDWCSCCYAHDLAYWRGGTAEERSEADAELQRCVLEKTQNPMLAKVMHDGVRVGGSPYFYTWYRWGYGWPYQRNYQALSPQEIALTQQHLLQHSAVTEAEVCKGEPLPLIR